MKLTIGRATLERELRLLTTVIDRKVTIPVLACVRIAALTNGQVSFASTNLDNALTTQCRADVAEGGSALVPADTFLGLVQRFPKEDCIIALKGDSVTVSAHGTTAKLSTLPVDDFPTLPVSDAPGAVFSAASLLDVIARTRYAMEESTYFPAGACCFVSKGELRVAATDSYQIVWATSKAPVFEAEFPLAVRSWDALVKFLSEEESDATVTLRCDENFAWWSTVARTLACRRLDRKFPQYRRLMPKPDDVRQTVTLPSVALQDALRRHAVVSSTKDKKATKFTFADGRLVLESRTDRGSVRDELEAPGCGASDLFVNTQYALNAIGALGADQITMSIAESGRVVFWRSAKEPDRMTALAATMVA